MSERKPVLSVKNIYCGYGKTEVLQGVSFQVFPNQKLCILGPNGCGKTTLLRAVNKILPVRGEITVLGRSTDQMGRREIAGIMAYMSQRNAVYFPYTVYETVMMGRYARHKGFFSRADVRDQKAVKECMVQTGVWELRDRLLTELSGGQFQRVMLSRVFAQSPDLILLDEPTNHLDLKYQIELMEYLNEWVGQGDRCVVSVLHDINLAFSFGDDILLIEDGKCTCQAPAKGFPMEKINRAYGMDVCGYMRTSLGLWEEGKKE